MIAAAFPSLPNGRDDLRAAADPAWLIPQWVDPVPGVFALMSTRQAPRALHRHAGQAPHDAFNLGTHVGEDPVVVSRRREALAAHWGARPVWLDQVHGNEVIGLNEPTPPRPADPPGQAPQADGAWSSQPGRVCAVMVADCLPVLLAVDGARGVAALHAGWRGLCGATTTGVGGTGVLEVGVRTLCEQTGCRPDQIQAWLGPCIGPEAFEVGADVLRGFGATAEHPGPGFKRHPRGPDKWLADLPALGRSRLRRLGLDRITGGAWCTHRDATRFFSFRRDGVTGRQAAFIALVSG